MLLKFENIQLAYDGAANLYLNLSSYYYIKYDFAPDLELYIFQQMYFSSLQTLNEVLSWLWYVAVYKTIKVVVISKNLQFIFVAGCIIMNMKFCLLFALPILSSTIQVMFGLHDMPMIE